MRVYRGKLKRQPCEQCGKKRAEAHHDNYSVPTRIKWLCRRCHSAHHYPLAAEQAELRAAIARRFNQLAEKYSDR